MCVIAFVSATIFNVQTSPTFCEQYILVTITRATDWVSADEI